MIAQIKKKRNKTIDSLGERLWISSREFSTLCRVFPTTTGDETIIEENPNRVFLKFVVSSFIAAGTCLIRTKGSPSGSDIDLSTAQPVEFDFTRSLNACQSEWIGQNTAGASVSIVETFYLGG